VKPELPPSRSEAPLPEVDDLLKGLKPLEAEHLAKRVRARLDGELPLHRMPLGRPRPLTWALATGIAGAAAALLVSLSGPERPLEPQTPAVDVVPKTLPAPEAPSVGEVPKPEPARPSPEETSPPARDKNGSPETAPRRTKSEAAPGANLLYEAARALRQEGNPGKALKLLEEAAKAVPGAGHSEEAEALRMEATYRLGGAQARTLAENYLKRFPNGRFRVTADNILAQLGRKDLPSQR
jgi:hypothetical protein